MSEDPIPLRCAEMISHLPIHETLPSTAFPTTHPSVSTTLTIFLPASFSLVHSGPPTLLPMYMLVPLLILSLSPCVWGNVQKAGRYKKNGGRLNNEAAAGFAAD